MLLVEKADASVEIVRKALPQMSRLGIPITPTNYAVWFEYMRADNRELHGELHAALSNDAVTPSLINDLYERYLRAGADQRALGAQMREGLNAVISAFRETVSSASAELGSYGAALEDFCQHITGDCGGQELTEYLAELAAHTRQLAQQNEILRAGLGAAAAEAVTLQQEITGETTPAVAAAPVMTDSVTGLMTRAAAAARFAEVAMDAFENDTHGPCLMLLDVDEFTGLHERHGAEAELSVLRGVSSTLGANLQESDLLARFDKGLFAVVLIGVPATDAPRVAETLRTAVAGQQYGDSGEIRVTLSIGLAWLRKDETLDDLIERADAVLFLSQEGGQNRVTVDR